MTYKTPLRLTILHFEQRFLTDDETFTITTPLRATAPLSVPSQTFIIPVTSLFV